MRLLILFCLLSFAATAQTAKKPTLTQRVEALEKSAKKRSAVTTDMLYAQYKIDQESKRLLIAKVDSLQNEL